MDIRKIKKLIELLEESGIAEIEIKEGEEAVRISRMPPAGAALAYPLTQIMHGAAAAPAAAARPPEAAAAPGAEGAAARPKPNEHVITAPMVGTFYGAPSPGAKPFVEIGDE
ncbi:MAG TPA: acetyl-CoA carboxylase biotin carboxyl carrier protein, partial [Steroidobacteraceae bacterium]|nr:acetyl-CoA carboxylase biotin carboxyl carrier protein [Steroidobacteraceae bacterium]